MRTLAKQGSLLSMIPFPLRIDRHGYRPVYPLGNQAGRCSYGCTFCGVKESEKVTPEGSIALFDALRGEYAGILDGPYHPVIYNKGNATVEQEFSRATLVRVLEAFRGDPRVAYVSINSREREATRDFLESLAAMELPFPVHFILGLESFSPVATDLIGKETRGELDRFIKKLIPFNRDYPGESPRYRFGLDVNLLLLPELHLEPGVPRKGHEGLVREGLLGDLCSLFSRLAPAVPVEVNLHPFYPVSSLDYEGFDLDSLFSLLPSFCEHTSIFNRRWPGHPIHLFLGVHGRNLRLGPWESTLKRFNETNEFHRPSIWR